MLKKIREKLYRLNNPEKRREIERTSQRIRRKRNPILARAKDRYWRIKYKIKKDAVNKLNNAVASGIIIKPSKCTMCKSSKNIQGHHDDYNKPLDVVWVCAVCHKYIHAMLLRKLEGKELNDGAK